MEHSQYNYSYEQFILKKNRSNELLNINKEKLNEIKGQSNFQAASNKESIDYLKRDLN